MKEKREEGKGVCVCVMRPDLVNTSRRGLLSDAKTHTHTHTHTHIHTHTHTLKAKAAAKYNYGDE